VLAVIRRMEGVGRAQPDEGVRTVLENVGGHCGGALLGRDLGNRSGHDGRSGRLGARTEAGESKGQFQSYLDGKLRMKEEAGKAGKWQLLIRLPSFCLGGADHSQPHESLERAGQARWVPLHRSSAA
jgi:hypothetical protein